MANEPYCARFSARPRFHYDACQCQQSFSRSRRQAPREMVASMLQHAPICETAGSPGAVSLGTGQFTRMSCAVLNDEARRRSFRRPLGHQGRGCCMTRAPGDTRCHHAMNCAVFVRRPAGGAALLFQPPFGPQLERVERARKLAARPAVTTRTGWRPPRICTGGELLLTPFASAEGRLAEAMPLSSRRCA